MERAFLEEQLAAGRSLEAIGRLVGKHPSTVGYWLKKHGLVAAQHHKFTPRGGLDRERLADCVDAGMNVRQIARACSVSYSTARYWLRRYGLETVPARQRAADRAARHVERECRRHGPTTFVLEGRGYYRCSRCRMERVAARRRKVKRILVEEAGGACVLCGFDAHPAALEFHHLEPAEKKFELSTGGVTRAIAALREEARKCVLVCSNCHALVEAGVLSVDGGARSPPLVK
jgi:hypothetical protein